MEWFISLFASLHFMIVIGLIAALIYLIFRRIELKKKEKFEKRDS